MELRHLRDALGLVPFQISPHFQDPDPNSTHTGERQEVRIVQFLEENETPVLGMREGAGVRAEKGLSDSAAPMARASFDAAKPRSQPSLARKSPGSSGRRNEIRRYAAPSPDRLTTRQSVSGVRNLGLLILLRSEVIPPMTPCPRRSSGPYRATTMLDLVANSSSDRNNPSSKEIHDYAL